MSPIYEYRCVECGHVTAMMRDVDDRHDYAGCERCLNDMELVISLPAKRTDGIYSYAPNIGSEAAFERKEEKIKQREEKKR